MRLSSEDDINEAVQNAIVNSFISIKSLKNANFFKTWIIRILINECNHIYSFQKGNLFEEYNEDMVKEISKDYINETIDNIDFFNLVKILNYDERMIITLFYSEDLSIKEISKIMNITQSTVSTKLSRARNKLKKILEGGTLYE
jgi:RNA polymerase sigma-70 factor (ECF subfamily)